MCIGCDRNPVSIDPPGRGERFSVFPVEFSPNEQGVYYLFVRFCGKANENGLLSSLGGPSVCGNVNLN